MLKEIKSFIKKNNIELINFNIITDYKELLKKIIVFCMVIFILIVSYNLIQYSIINKYISKTYKIITNIYFYTFTFVNILLINVIATNNIDIFAKESLFTNNSSLILLEISTLLFFLLTERPVFKGMSSSYVRL